MAWNGTGTYIQVTPVASGSNAWADTKAAGDLNITTTDHDYHDQDIADGITNCIAKDGQNSAINDLPMGGHKHTGVADAVSSDQYASLAQLIASAPVLGAFNAAMLIVAASFTGSFTATQAIVSNNATTRGYRLGNINKSIDLSTVGLGGMDIGSPPASGYVAIYLMFNPTTLDVGLLATDASSAIQTQFYSSGSRPAGYTASCLVSVWPTNGTGRLVAGSQVNRKVHTAQRQAISTSTQQASATSLSISGQVPRNALGIDANVTISSTSSGTLLGEIGPTNFTGLAIFSTVGTLVIGNVSGLMLATAATVFYIATASAGTMTFVIQIYAYTF